MVDMKLGETYVNLKDLLSKSFVIIEGEIFYNQTPRTMEFRPYLLRGVVYAEDNPKDKRQVDHMWINNNTEVKKIIDAGLVKGEQGLARIVCTLKKYTRSFQSTYNYEWSLEKRIGINEIINISITDIKQFDPKMNIYHKNKFGNSKHK
jgi:hypothetical protein